MEIVFVTYVMLGTAAVLLLAVALNAAATRTARATVVASEGGLACPRATAAVDVERCYTCPLACSWSAAFTGRRASGAGPNVPMPVGFV